MEGDQPSRERRPPSGRPDVAEARRRRAAELFEAGMAQAEVARRLGVSRQTAHRWHVTWRGGGADALRHSGRRGPPAGLTEADVGNIGAALRQGPQAHGFPDERWSCRQVGWLIEQIAGVGYHPSHVSRLIRRHQWPVEGPFALEPSTST